MASLAPIKILIHEWVTGGGLVGASVPPSWAAEGLAMRRAIAADFASLPGSCAQVIVTIDDRWPDEPSPWTTIPTDSTSSSQWLAAYAREDADVVVLIAPETGGTLARLVLGLEIAGARSLGSSAQAIQLTANKAKLGDCLGARGISTPVHRFVVPALGLPADAQFPAVLKPVDGAGSVDTYRLASAADLPSTALKMPVALLQPFHAGIPMSASFLVGERSSWLIGIGRQRISFHDGRIVYQGGVMPVACEPAMPLLRRAVESVPGLRGFVGVDFLWEPERDQILVLEINPRPTASFVGLSQVLPPGCLAAAWLAACGVPGFDGDTLDDLSGIVHRQPPIVFNADGTICPEQQVAM